MIELMIVLEILRAVNLVLEIIHSQILRKKIDTLEAAKLNQCANCSQNSSNQLTD